MASGIYNAWYNFSTHDDGNFYRSDDLPAGSSHIPSPWIQASAQFEFSVSTLKLTDDKYFTSIKLLRVLEPLTFVECEYRQEASQTPYTERCMYGMREISTVERQGVVDTLNDILRIADGYTALLSRTKADSVTFLSHNLDIERGSFIAYESLEPSPSSVLDYFALIDSIQAPVATKLLAGLDRHISFQSTMDSYNRYISNPDAREDRLFFGMSLGDRTNLGLPPLLVFSLRGLQVDPRFRSGSGSVEFKMLCSSLNENCRS